MSNISAFYTTDNNYSIKSDEQLIALIKSGDKIAIDFLIEKYKLKSPKLHKQNNTNSDYKLCFALNLISAKYKQSKAADHFLTKPKTPC